MKRSLTATLLVVSLAAGCESSGSDMNNHWSARSVPPRMQRFFLGYNADKDGTYRDFQWKRKMDLQVLMRRYLLHLNPDNPNHPEYQSRFEQRPNHSVLPNPVPYIHLEGVILGMVAWGAGLGPFGSIDWIPLPVDSFIGTLEKGGVTEFVAGIAEVGTQVGVITTTFLDANVPGYEGTQNVTRVTLLGD